MTISLDSVVTTLVEWAAGVTGVTVIQSHQQGPRPVLPFGTVQLLNVIVPGTSYNRQDLDDPDVTIHDSWMTLTVQFAFFGGTPRQACYALVEALNLESTGVIMREAGLGIGPNGPITDQPQLRENGFEASCAVDITFHGASSIEETVGYIGTVTTVPTFN